MLHITMLGVGVVWLRGGGRSGDLGVFAVLGPCKDSSDTRIDYHRGGACAVFHKLDHACVHKLKFTHMS